MEYHRYSSDYVGSVQDKEARGFLSTTGLPSTSDLFTAEEASADGSQGVSSCLLRIGYSTEGEGYYYVDCRSGAVLYIEEYAQTNYHVNSSPEHFAACLAEFQHATFRVPPAADPAEYEELARSLGSTIESIDPSALQEDPGFWHSLLADVAVGDYSGDEE